MSPATVAALAIPPRSEPLPVAAVGDRPPWPKLDRAALHGLPGQVVRTIEPHTEADPAALLITFLTAFGSAVGAGPHALADGAHHPGRLFAVVVGQTARARKGTSYQRIRQIMRKADEGWADGTITGLASGEGLVKEASTRADRRLFVHEGEFARLLRVAGREGATLSPILREAWDGGTLRVLTKEPLTAKDSHVSIVGHVTVEELQSTLSAVEAANGFANRFLFVCARRSSILPRGGNLDDADVHDLGSAIAGTLDQARKHGHILRSPAAEDRWHDLYHELAADDPSGMLGALLARAEAQLLRLSVVYALCDGSRWVCPEHLDAAHALWRYCRDSTAHIFGDRIGDPDADRVVTALRSAGGSLSREDLRRTFSGHLTGRRMDRVLELLEERGVITRTAVSTGGRPRQLILLVDAAWKARKA